MWAWPLAPATRFYLSKFHRITGRSSYSCQYCGHHVYPTAGTIFHKSSVSLQLWFFAVYLMSSTRCGISAKQLEREIGVTYKTAHRMFKQIRSLLSDNDQEPLSGKVEVDESAYGGKARDYESLNRRGHLRRAYRPTMFAEVERGGRVRPQVIPDRKLPALHKAVQRHVLPSAMLFTDEWAVSASDDARIKKLVDENPNVDGGQLREMRALLKRLEREGVGKQSYAIISPYERKPLRHASRRIRGAQTD
jgi:transposase-like protein